MTKRLKTKLTKAPLTAGVYLYKDETGSIIYVGKASHLRRRLRQYFQPSRPKDAKTARLVASIKDVDWIETESEIDALFLEAELIKRYQPKYNIELRDDKSDIYLRVNLKDRYPYVSYTRRPLDDGASYFGPFASAQTLKQAMRALRKIYPYSTHKRLPKRVCLHYHLGLCPGLEENKTGREQYLADLRRLISYISGNGSRLIGQTQKEMELAAKARDYERAARLRDQLKSLRLLRHQVIFGQREFMDTNKDEALAGLRHLLGLRRPPRRIEGYDISHMSGDDTAASMVVFINGLPAKSEYRRFRSRFAGNDDYAHIGEVVRRRFAYKSWPRPDLILIDGGKGQLSSALTALKEANLVIPAIGLAKRHETVIIKKGSGFQTVNLDADAPELRLLMRIRDEAHRFAVAYHHHLKQNKVKRSILDEVNGIGPVTKAKLLRHFGSVDRIKQASVEALSTVIGQQRGRSLYNFLRHQVTGR